MQQVAPRHDTACARIDTSAPAPLNRRSTAVTFLTRAILALALTSSSAIVAAAQPTTEQDKTLYALGVAMSRGITEFNLTPAELEVVKAGLTAGVQGKTDIDPQAYFPQIRELQMKRAAAAADTEKKAGADYLAKAGQAKGAKTTASGLVITTLKEGTGASPAATDTVKVHYHGTLRNGEVFDSSVQRNEPATFPLNGVIPCWTEGVQLMKVGGKARLVCPSSIAYGDQGSPPTIQPGATLTFEVELLGIEKQ